MTLNHISAINGESISSLYDAAVASIRSSFDPSKGTQISDFDIEALAWDAVARIYEKRESYNPSRGASMRTWASRIAHMIFMDFIRDESKWQYLRSFSAAIPEDKDVYDFYAVPGEGGKYLAVSSSRDTAENEAIGQLEVEAIEEVIDTLPERDAIIVRKHIEGYTDKEIAKEMGLSHCNTRRRLHESRKALTSTLESPCYHCISISCDPGLAA